MLEIHSTADSEIKLLFERRKVKNLRKKERLLKIASTQQTPKKRWMGRGWNVHEVSCGHWQSEFAQFDHHRHYHDTVSLWHRVFSTFSVAFVSVFPTAMATFYISIAWLGLSLSFRWQENLKIGVPSCHCKHTVWM